MPKRNSLKTSLADRADRYRLYEQSVQDPVAEVELLQDFYRRARGRAARSLREDFAGTARVACEWVSGNTRHRAVAVDNDPRVLQWGREHNYQRLKPGARRRIELVLADVLEAPRGPFDLITAMNFSYWLFRDRASLRQYFASVKASLERNGLFLLDAYGGYDAYRMLRERRKVRNFTYIWEQADFDPVSSCAVCHIHFRFRDGSSLRRAFSYEWRLWTLPEIRELLAEAGFAESRVLWQGTDVRTGQGNGVFQPTERGDPDPAWIAYIEAEPY